MESIIWSSLIVPPLTMNSVSLKLLFLPQLRTCVSRADQFGELKLLIWGLIFDR